MEEIGRKREINMQSDIKRLELLYAEKVGRRAGAEAGLERGLGLPRAPAPPFLQQGTRAPIPSHKPRHPCGSMGARCGSFLSWLCAALIVIVTA